MVRLVPILRKEKSVDIFLLRDGVAYIRKELPARLRHPVLPQQDREQFESVCHVANALLGAGMADNGGDIGFVSFTHCGCPSAPPRCPWTRCSCRQALQPPPSRQAPDGRFWPSAHTSARSRDCGAR